MPIQISARLGPFISSRFVELAIRSKLRSAGWVMARALIVAVMCGCGAEERSETFEIPPDRVVLTRPAQHMVVQGLQFPPSNPTRLKLQPVRVFPDLDARHLIMMTEAPDQSRRFFILERGGLIRILGVGESGASAPVFLDLQEKVWSDAGSGLLGMAFDPGFEENRTFYVHYTTDNPRTVVISAFQAFADRPDHADPNSELVLIRLEKTHRSHNGGMLAFGPDGMLYIAIGDAFKKPERYNHAQDLTSLFGKILRVDPWAGSPYGIPPDNPFVGREDGTRPKIWAYGFRQPWRFSFDGQTGEMWLGEVGRGDYEEINLVKRGANYGWSAYEGPREHSNRDRIPFEKTAAPLLSIPHARTRAVIGGYVYRGGRLLSVRGSYIYGDAVSGTIWALRQEQGQVVSQTEVSFVEGVASFAEDRQGNLYAVSLHGGIYRFEEASSVPFPQHLSATGLFRDVESLDPSAGLVPYDVVSPLWSDGARKRRWVALPGETKIGFQRARAWEFPRGTVLVKHFEMRIHPKDPPRRLETRVLIHETTGWAGYTYKWNKQQTDADLLTASESDQLTISGPNGGSIKVDYVYPGPGDCMRCHTESAGWVLGLRTNQINFSAAYDQGPANQLSVLSELGLFRERVHDGYPPPAMVDPSDRDAPIQDRARAYLAANCSNCHRGDGVNGPMDLRYEVPIEKTATIRRPLSEGPSTIRRKPFQHIVTPENKELSFLWARMMSTAAKHRMPPVGSTRPDSLGARIVGAWIDQGAY